MIDNIVFDLDGTLIDTIEDLKNSVNFALCENGFPPKTGEEVRLCVGNGIRQLVYDCLPDGVDEKIKEKCFEDFKGYYSKHSMDNTFAYDGIKEVLKGISQSGYKISVVTNKIQPEAEKIIRAFFGDIFDVIIGQKDGMPQKPAPDGVLKAIEQMGCKKENSVYIGDSQVDCLTAHNAGLPIIGVTWGFRSRQVLREYNAEIIIDKPEEILGILDVRF